MFEDSLIESGGKLRTNRGKTTTISFILQVALVGVLVLIPLIFTEALPKQLAAFGIAGGEGMGLRRLLLSHPPLEERIAALQALP